MRITSIPYFCLGCFIPSKKNFLLEGSLVLLISNILGLKTEAACFRFAVPYVLAVSS
jgi:hypothetical protein